jgi:hypothetical protein
MPKRPHPPTAFDFWDQVKQAEELEELRAHRPSAFQALPKVGTTQGAGEGAGTAEERAQGAEGRGR